MKLLITCILLTAFLKAGGAQEIRAGITLGGNLYQNTKVSLPIYFPENTYLTLIEENKGEGLINAHNIFNSYNIGGVLTGYYKKLSLTIEPQFVYKRHSLQFKKPQNLNWIVMEKGFRMPIYFSYRLTKSAQSIELLTGITVFKTKTVDFQSPTFDFSFFGDSIYAGNIYYGRNIFNDVLYNNKTYYMFLLGFKKPLNKWDMIFKFQSYINSNKNPIEAKYFQMEISFNRYIFNSKDFINKHYLYVE